MTGASARPGPPAVPESTSGPPPAAGRADRLLPGLVRVTAPNPGMMTGPGTNTYVVGAGDVAVVDPGPDDPVHRGAIEEAVAADGARIRWVLVTHTHPDHAPGAAPLARRAGASLIGFGARDGFDPDVVAAEGWTLSAPSFELRAVHTPGHAGNHLCWLLAEPRALLSGDHVMQGSTVVIRPPDGDMADYVASLERLLSFDPPLAFIAPGHGRLLDDPAPVLAGTIAHRVAREDAVLAALRRCGPAGIDELLPSVYGDVEASRLPLARFSLWAHLRKLVVDDRVVVAERPEPPPEAERLEARDRDGEQPAGVAATPLPAEMWWRWEAAAWPG